MAATTVPLITPPDTSALSRRRDYALSRGSAGKRREGSGAFSNASASAASHRDDKNQGLTAAIWFQTREIEGKFVRAEPALEGGHLFFPDLGVAVGGGHGQMAVFDGKESHASLGVSSFSRFHAYMSDSTLRCPHVLVVWPGRKDCILILQQD